MSLIQRPLWEPTSGWQLPNLAKLPSWSEAKRVAVDIETDDPGLTTLGPGEWRDGRIVGVSFSIEDAPEHSYYLPFGHATGPNLDREQVLTYLRDQAESFKGILVGQNLPYDLGYLRRANVMFDPKRYRDVKLAAAILDENAPSYTLDAIAKRMGIDGKDEGTLRDAAWLYGVDPKAEMWKLPAEHVAGYAIRDVTLPLQILRKQERQIENEDLWKTYDLESDVLPIMVKMRERGVKVDQEHLALVEWTADKKEREHLKEVKRLTGVEITPENINKKDAVAPALQKIGIRLKKTENKQFQIDAALLESIDHPVGEHLLRAKKANKIRTTFCKSIWTALCKDGRIRCSLNQMPRDNDGGTGRVGTVSGRMSATRPNLQQQPSRDPEWGVFWRKIYIPDEGKLWACLDYSSQEPRGATHFAAALYAATCGNIHDMPKWIQAFMNEVDWQGRLKRTELPLCSSAMKIVQEYIQNPRLDFHQMMADIAGVGRKEAKTLFLGILYGMGEAKLCDQLGLPKVDTGRTWKGKPFYEAGPEGKALMRKFHEAVPFAKELADAAKYKAGYDGFVRTWIGRKARFERKPDGTFDFTHKALNRIVQGSAADQLKIGLVALDAAGFEPQLPVHDELDVSVESVAQAQEMARIMEEAMPLRVPSVVDVECGPSWGEVKAAA